MEDYVKNLGILCDFVEDNLMDGLHMDNQFRLITADHQGNNDILEAVRINCLEASRKILEMLRFTGQNELCNIYLYYKYLGYIASTNFYTCIPLVIYDVTQMIANKCGLYFGHFLGIQQPHKTKRLSECLPALLHKWNLIMKYVKEDSTSLKKNDDRQPKYGLSNDIRQYIMYKGDKVVQYLLYKDDTMFDMKQMKRNHFNIATHNTMVLSMCSSVRFINMIYITTNGEKYLKDCLNFLNYDMFKNLCEFKCSEQNKSFELILQAMNLFFFGSKITDISKNLIHFNRYERNQQLDYPFKNNFFKLIQTRDKMVVLDFLETNKINLGYLFNVEQKYQTESVEEAFNIVKKNLFAEQKFDHLFLSPNVDLNAVTRPMHQMPKDSSLVETDNEDDIQLQNNEADIENMIENINMESGQINQELKQEFKQTLLFNKIHFETEDKILFYKDAIRDDELEEINGMIYPLYDDDDKGGYDDNKSWVENINMDPYQ